MFKYLFLFHLTLLSLFSNGQQPQFFETTEKPINPNGRLDRVEELINRTYHQPYMNDGVRLWLDVCVPEFRDSMDVTGLQIQSGGFTLNPSKLIVGDKGLRYFIYKNQSDPHQLPTVLSRTPYGAYWWHQQGHLMALMGFCGIVNDMRGKMNSEGTYYPMYSDSWKKTGYINYGNALDTTTNHAANEHQDGYEVVRYIADSLRWDTDSNGQLTVADGLISNGNIGMQGASAVGNSQLQAAAVEDVNVHPRGLKALFPVNATLEYQRYAGYQNGCWRSGLIAIWLLGQMTTSWFSPYDTLDAIDNSVWNNMKTIRDYGIDYTQYPDRTYAATAAAKVGIKFWTTENRAYFPNSPFRATMDASAARLNTLGQNDLNGNVSRYKNLDVPTYHLSGWWDIFCEGQLETWRLQRLHSPLNKKFQKMVIGPWSHNTNGNPHTGDVTYPENSGNVTSMSLDGMETQKLITIQKEEMLEWFRSHLSDGEKPVFHLPARSEWQQFSDVQAGAYEIQAPAFDYEASYVDWYNYMNADAPLDSFPIIFHRLSNNQFDTQYVQLPVRPDYLIYYINDAGWKLHSIEHMEERSDINWDENGGTAPLRFYVPGPVNDGIAYNESVGNYWTSSDTFPLRNEQRKKLYFHRNGTLDWTAPVADEGEQRWCADPSNPCRTHGGNNMEERTPDQMHESLGQMDFRDPAYVNQVLTRPLINVDGEMMDDLLEYTSGTLQDSFTTIGFPKVKLWMKSSPQQSDFPNLAAFDIFVRVLDVTPDGHEYFVMEGSVNSRYREWARTVALTDTEDVNALITNLNANQYYDFDFRMQPMAYSFGKGHKIKVLISGSNYNRFTVNQNVPINDNEYYFSSSLQPFANIFQGVGTPPTIALNTLKFSDQMQAYIDFPYLGQTPVLSGLEDLKHEDNFSVEVFPNPTSGHLTVSMDKAGFYSLKVYNHTGMEVLGKTMDNTNADVSFNNFSKGFYLLKITDANGQSVTKSVVVQ